MSSKNVTRLVVSPCRYVFSLGDTNFYNRTKFSKYISMIFLSVNGERMYTKYWLNASGRLAQEQCG